MSAGSSAVSGIEHGGPTEQALVEPLSERELDVLRLLGSELDGPAIARELMVSLNTMRTHTKNIYAKLAVTNRRAAVAGPPNSTCCRGPMAPGPDLPFMTPAPETWRGLCSGDRGPAA